MKINSQNIKNALTQMMTVVGLFLFMGLLLSAIERKENLDSVDLIIEIDGEKGKTFITKEDVKNTVKRRYGHILNGVPLGSLDVQEVEVILEKDAFVKNADVYIGAQNTVYIRIEERRPMVRVIDADGASFYLDDEGNFLPPSTNFTARVLVATGNIPTYTDSFLQEKKNTLNGMYHLVTYINNDKFLKPLVEQIYVNKKGEFVLVPKVGEHTIMVGKANRLDEKFDNLKIFYKEGIPYEGWRKYKSINLKFKGQVVCKKK